jgi:hypothetical protein
MGAPLSDRLLEAAGVEEVVLGFPDILQQDSLRFFAAEFII